MADSTDKKRTDVHRDGFVHKRVHFTPEQWDAITATANAIGVSTNVIIGTAIEIMRDSPDELLDTTLITELSTRRRVFSGVNSSK